jgi:hypothetical protein
MLCCQHGGFGTNAIESIVHHHVAMRVAIASDIHGNLPALEDVVDDIGGSGVDAIFNLGDSLSGPLMPLGTARS